MVGQRESGRVGGLKRESGRGWWGGLDLKRCLIHRAPSSAEGLKIETNGLKKKTPYFLSWVFFFFFFPFFELSEMHRICLDVVYVEKRVKMASVLIYSC